MTKKFLSITLIFLATMIVISCSDVRTNTGRVYMPDMSYSRALETYAKLDSSKFTNNPAELGEGKIYYTAFPVAGTMARGDEMPFAFAIDKPGDTTNYFASRQAQNPLPALDAGQMKEAERLYLVNCAICHGSKLDGNGPLWKDGSGPFTSAPKNLMTLDMPDGQMFYSVTYGKNMMGSYASQITDKQRWMIIHYIKAQQTAKSASSKPAASDSTGGKAKTDTTAKAKVVS
ncbi:MAG TPA: cytochrome c [Chitinophagaceae bacterium]|jgi:mono/diheme cytochrome c family protein|nr:cytochrome c [Chitinophagaceae bacterium]